LVVDHSSNCDISYNNFVDNQFYGVGVSTGSQNNTIHHNNFILNNGGLWYQAYDNTQQKNHWYDRRVNIGNYWDNYDGSGPHPLYAENAWDLFPVLEPFNDSWVDPPSPPDDTYEENDVFADAGELDFGNYSLVSTDDDYFKFLIIGYDYFEIVLTYDSTWHEVDLYLLNSIGGVIDSSTSADNILSIFHSPALTTYLYTFYIFVDYIEGPSGTPYELALNATIIIPDDIYEDNDELLDAVGLDINDTYTLMAHDDDYFFIEVDSYHPITLELAFNYARVNLDLYLLDELGRVFHSSKSAASPETIEYTTTYPGFYFIAIEHVSGKIGIEYTLSITVGASLYNDDIYEDNDFLEDAKLLEVGEKYNLFYTDIDFFKIKLEAGTTYEFTLKFDSDVIDLDFYLVPQDFSGDPNEILAGSELYTSPEYFTFAPNNTGTYYLFIWTYIEGDDVLTPTSYTLEISTTRGSFFPILFVPLTLFILSTVRRRKKTRI
jgi:hypothetical protein